MRFLPVVGVVLGLAACTDPLAGVDRLADVDVVATDAAAALPDAEEVAREGFLGTSAAQGSIPDAVQAPDADKAETGGFFRGLIKRAANADPAAAIAADVAAKQSSQVVIETTAVTTNGSASDAVPVELAALPAAEASPREELNSGRGGRGLFGRNSGGASKKDAPRNGPDARDVPFGTVLAFGEMARVCDAKGKSLGQKIDGLGRRGFALHDSNPGIRDKRTFYITGFGDNCPRQFTAANALFGAPSFYETIRYSPAGKHLPYAATDKAYDGVKSSVCRKAKNAPCGTRIGKLDTELAFVSAYEFSEHNGKWKEFLIHDGEVLASAVKSY